MTGPPSPTRHRRVLSTAGDGCLLPDVPLIRLAIIPIHYGPVIYPDTGVRIGSVCEGLDGSRVPVCRLAAYGRCDLEPLPSEPDTEQAETALFTHYVLHHLEAV